MLVCTCRWYDLIMHQIKFLPFLLILFYTFLILSSFLSTSLSEKPSFSAFTTPEATDTPSKLLTYSFVNFFIFIYLTYIKYSLRSIYKCSYWRWHSLYNIYYGIFTCFLPYISQYKFFSFGRTWFLK